MDVFGGLRGGTSLALDQARAWAQPNRHFEKLIKLNFRLHLSLYPKSLQWASFLKTRAQVYSVIEQVSLGLSLSLKGRAYHENRPKLRHYSYLPRLWRPPSLLQRSNFSTMVLSLLQWVFFDDNSHVFELV